MISKMLSLLVLILILGCSGAQSAIAETQDISNLETIALSTLHFPREVCTPQVRHTSVIQDYALVEWQCGDAGGEMLLKKEQNAWQLITGDGGAYQTVDLIRLGVPQDIAAPLLQQLEAQWGQAG